MNQYYAQKSEVITEQEKEHFTLARKIAASGIVLLEHNGILPLKKGSSIALYGYGARNTVYCGFGAASINCRDFVSVESGLEQVGLNITSKGYLDRYSEEMKKEEDAYYDNLRKVSQGDLLKGVLKMYGEPFVPVSQPSITKEDIQEANTDTAIYVISRNSGEGADRKYVEGDYLLLKTERRNLEFLSSHFKHLIVLLNVGGVIDTSFLRSIPNMAALLMMGQSGGVTGSAVADVLVGNVVPEGKLTTTWAKEYKDYPNANTYAALNGNLDDEFYTEGIYVGYRYFDSFGIEPAYPFGFGLSYTSFEIKVKEISADEAQIKVIIEVLNIGKQFSGREVVQVYITAPEGELNKAKQTLTGYAKTAIIDPGKTDLVAIIIDTKSLASYSEKDAAWILEPGDYLIQVGNSSRNTQIVGIASLDEKVITEQCKNLFPLDCKLHEMSTKDVERFQKKIASKHIIDVPIFAICGEKFKIVINDYKGIEENSTPSVSVNKAYRLEEVWTGKLSMDEFVNSLTEEEMVYLCVGNTGADEGVGNEGGSVVCAGVGSAGSDEEIPVSIVPGACDTTRKLIKSRGTPNMNMADGGSGLRLVSQYEVDKDGNLLTSGLLSIRGVDKILGEDKLIADENNTRYYQYTTGLPMGTLLAQTWDKSFCEQCGKIVGKELQTYHVQLLLAPSMNIHRNPLCGRNFEYYSEDPLITGECGAAVVKGVQSISGVGATIKHLACNNQEDNRGATNAHVSERALREVYLKGYEIAVRKSQPVAMMTSLNLINGIHAANSYDLLTVAARMEWGFRGMVMTDWGTTSQNGKSNHKYKSSTCAGCIHAGNDLIMPGSQEDIQNLLASVKNGEIDIYELKTCVKNILKTITMLYN